MSVGRRRDARSQGPRGHQAVLERWGFAKLTIDDIADEARVSRATIYRMFPGGKDVLFEAHAGARARGVLRRPDAELVGADSLEDVLVRAVVTATRGCATTSTSR